MHLHKAVAIQYRRPGKVKVVSCKHSGALNSRIAQVEGKESYFHQQGGRVKIKSSNPATELPRRNTL